MSLSRAADVTAEGSDVDDATASPAKPGDDLGVFLATLAEQLRDTLARFGHTADRVTEMVVSDIGQSNRELIVALQDFDRLQQEFAAIGNVLARTGASATINWPGGEGIDTLKRELISEISIADLRERILMQLDALPPEPPPPPLSEDELEAEF